MKITETKINGLLKFETLKFDDLRGSLIKPYSESFFSETRNINLDFKETWFTRSKKNVIRAMHMQVGDYPCEKLVSVIEGAVLDVVLDLRKNSETFGEWFEIELNSTNTTALYIPKGCAHGYKVLKENTITMYMGTEVNVPKDDIGIRWDSFGYDWQIENPILSEKDQSLPLIEEYSSLKDSI